MSMSYIVKDPWEGFIYRFLEGIKDGLEIKVSYNGIEAGVNLDREALEKLASLFERGTPIEVALGIDLPRILSSIEGKELTMVLKSRDTELNLRITGDALNAFREAMQHNPIDGEAISMLGKLLRRVIG